MHFKPEWDDEEKEHKELENDLRDLYDENSLWLKTEGHRAWFPHKCLGAGCAEWAYKIVCDFSEEFTTRLNIKSRLS